MSGGRKFNIWIVYSDLFTNLSTFLFVAALGVFGGLGSAVVPPEPPAPSVPVTCDIPETVLRSLEAGSLLTPIEPGSVPCRRYYRIDGYAFQSWTSELWTFKANERALKPAEAFVKVCTPVWKAIAQRAFDDQLGRVIVHGIGRHGSLWPGQPSCPRLKAPPSTLLTVPPGKSAIDAINECLAGVRAGTICSEIADCDWRRPADELCRQAAAIRDWDRAETAQCLRTVAVDQAQALTTLCEGWVNHHKGVPRFPTTDFAGEGMSTIARFDQTRPALWRRVGTSGFVKDAPVTASSDEGAQAMLASQPSGAIVIELRLGR